MLNTVAISGRLVRDPEIVEASSTKICRFTLAVQDDYKSKDGNNAVNYIDCTAFGQKGEFIQRNFNKGDMAIVTGAIKTGSYKDKDGNSRKTFGITVGAVYFGQSKRSSGGNGKFENVAFSSDEDLPF